MPRFGQSRAWWELSPPDEIAAGQPYILAHALRQRDAQETLLLKRKQPMLTMWNLWGTRVHRSPGDLCRRFQSSRGRGKSDSGTYNCSSRVHHVADIP